MKNVFKKLNHYFRKLIYPNEIKCIFCGDELNQNEYNSTCEKCLKVLPFVDRCCEKCGNPISVNNTAICSICRTSNYNFVQARSVFKYKDEVLNTIHRFKYHNGKYLYKPLTKFMLDYFATSNLFVDFVTFVPMFKKKEKLRGYNQAKLLAEEFCKHANLKLYDFCEKIVDNTSQTDLDFNARRENVKDTFKFRTEMKSEIKDKIVLVIDDIFTTGATTNEVCKVMLNAGAKECYVFTLAHTMLEENALKENK